MKSIFKNAVLLVCVFLQSTLCSGFDNWVIKTNMPMFPCMFTSGFALNGCFYVVNGTHTSGGQMNGSFMYDPSNNTWTQKASIPTSLSKLHAFSIGNFGYVGIGGSGGSTNAWFEYDPISNTWTAKAPFPGMCRFDGAAFSINNIGYIVGGSGSTNYEVWSYHASTDTWLQKNDVPWRRVDAGFFVLNQKGYVVAGRVNGNPAADCWEYDPVFDSWTVRASIPLGTYYSGISFNIGNKGYFGFGDTGVNLFWEYNPISNTWISRNNNSAPVSGFYWHCNSSFGTATRGFAGGPGNMFSFPHNWFEYIPPNLVLPVELKDFEIHVKQKDVQLKWSTASETNNSHFVLEHSRNGIDFSSLGVLEGHGITSSEKKYEFTHYDAEVGRHYYRLNQFDFDGQSNLSNILNCLIAEKALPVRAWYSLEDNSLKIENLVASQIYDLYLYSLSGNNIFHKAIFGTSSSTIPLNEMEDSQGVYVFSITQGNTKIVSGKLLLN